MQKKKKNKTTGLSNKTVLTDASKFVMDVKLLNLNSSINKFFKNDSVDNLHSIRIALRRVRYSLEIFAICFNKKKYQALYKKLERLQDLSGSARDLDVLTLNMNKLKEQEKIPISKKIFESIEENKYNIKEDLKLELMQFIHSKSLKEFQSLLNIKKPTKGLYK